MTTSAGAAPSTSTSRSTPPSRRCSATAPFRRSIQRSCRHLLVDEFQDLTPAHVLLVRLLALPALDVFGVGDDDQCIYGHAGADPAFLIDYERLFPGAVPHPLTVNYRCPVAVVEGARTLLAYNHRRVAKQIDPGPASDPSPDALRVVEHGRDDGAAALVTTVRAWLGEPGVEPTSVAVLARVNSLLLAPHVALHDAGVPVSSVLRPDVLERTGMRAALAYLRIAAVGRRPRPGRHRRDPAPPDPRPARSGSPSASPARSRWSLAQLDGLADQVPDKDGPKVLRLVDDLRVVVDAGRAGHDPRRPRGRPRRHRARRRHEPARPHRWRPGLQPPRRHRRPARRRRPAPRPRRLRAVAARGVQAGDRSRPA